MFDQSLTSVGPESLQTLDIDFALAKSLTMIDFEMPVPAKHQRIEAFLLLGIHDTTPA